MPTSRYPFKLLSPQRIAVRDRIQRDRRSRNPTHQRARRRRSLILRPVPGERLRASDARGVPPESTAPSSNSRSRCPQTSIEQFLKLVSIQTLDVDPTMNESRHAVRDFDPRFSVPREWLRCVCYTLSPFDVSSAPRWRQSVARYPPHALASHLPSRSRARPIPREHRRRSPRGLPRVLPPPARAPSPWRVAAPRRSDHESSSVARPRTHRAWRRRRAARCARRELGTNGTNSSAREIKARGRTTTTGRRPGTRDHPSAVRPRRDRRGPSTDRGHGARAM